MEECDVSTVLSEAKIMASAAKTCERSQTVFPGDAFAYSKL